MEIKKEEKKVRKPHQALEKLIPAAKEIARKSEKAIHIITAKMISLGERAGKTFPKYAPGLTQVAIVQAAYSLAIGVAAIAIGSSSLVGIIAANLPLAIYATAIILKKVLK